MIADIRETGWVATKLPKPKWMRKLLYKALGIRPQKVYEPSVSNLLEELSKNCGIGTLELNNDIVYTTDHTIHVRGKALLIILTRDAVQVAGRTKE